jgi:hypothetical protein
MSLITIPPCARPLRLPSASAATGVSAAAADSPVANACTCTTVYPPLAALILEVRQTEFNGST